MENNKNAVTSKYAAVLLVATQFGIGLQVLPSLLAEKAGHDGWISLVVCGLFVLLAVRSSLALCRRFNSQSVLDITGAVCGRVISFAVNMLLLFCLLFNAIADYTLFVTGVGIWFFRSTPAWALAAFLILPSVLLAAAGLKSVCRFNFLFFVVIPLILLLICLNLRDFRITALLPLGEAGLSAIFKAVPVSLFAFTGFEILLFIYPYINDKTNLPRKFTVAALVTTLLFCMVTVATAGVFGEELVSMKFNAVLALARIIKVPVIERLDLYFLAVWITAMTLTINTYLFLVRDTMIKIFKPKSSFVTSLTAVLLVVVPASFIEDNNLIMKLLGFSGFVSAFVGFVIPVALFVTAVFRNIKGGTNT